MTIRVEIPEELFRRIQRNAIAFEETTPAAVLERWANHMENLKDPRTHNSEPPTLALKPVGPPDLLHTRVQGTFGNEPFSNWNDLVRVAHIVGFQKAGTFEELRSHSMAQIRKGKFADCGFRYIPEIDISVQGVDANRAWHYAFRLAQYVSTPIRASVEWRNNPKAAMPSQCAVLEWKP